MSTADDRQVLMEYETWKDRDVDLSIDAFLAQREDEANTRQVAEALAVLNRVIPNERPAGVTDYAMDAVEKARDILQADREYVEVQTIGGENWRIEV